MNLIKKKTLHVNLFGAPGAGKSTIRAGTFYKLKMSRINVEEVTEFAKDLTWEKRSFALKCQPYVFGKQLRNMERLDDQVDVVINDSPILLSSFYPKKYFPEKYPESFHTFVLDQFKSMNNLNFFITRVKQFDPIGRNQTADESDEIAREIRCMLEDNGITFIDVDGDELAVNSICHKILMEMRK